MPKVEFDIESFKAEQKIRAENRRAELRQTWAIILSAIGLVVGAFAAGAAWWNYFHVIH